MLISTAGLAAGQTPRFRITVDSLCYSWHVCVYDSNVAAGVKGLGLLDNRVNVSFDSVDDPMNSKYVAYESARRHVCFTVRVDNAKKDAYAPLYIIDDNGNGKLVPLTYRADSPFDLPSPGRLRVQPFDTASQKYVAPYTSEEVCGEYILINKSKVSRSYQLESVELQPPFRITKVSKPVGAIIRPGDTLKIGICFVASDTIAHQDSLYLMMGCYQFKVPVFGQAGTGIIVADDKDFGTASGGMQKCATIGVKNAGNKAFTLDKNWVMVSHEDFLFDTTEIENQFPITLAPGKSHKFTICYSARREGTQSSWILWSTDIRPPFKGQLKPFSDFTGSTLAPSIHWDRKYQKLQLGNDLDTVHRVNLINEGLVLAALTRIWIDGPDADEFSIVATESDMNPPTWGGTTISKKNDMWLDVAFKANTSKPLSSTRTAFLRTSSTFDPGTIHTIDLEGNLGAAGVNNESELVLTMYPNPAQDKVSLDLHLKEVGDVAVSVYDMLGREVASGMFAHCNAGKNSLRLRLPNVDSGVYFVRIAANGKVQTLPLEINR